MHEQIFETVSCIAPNRLIGLLFYHLRQLNKTFGVEHRVATGKGRLRLSASA